MKPKREITLGEMQDECEKTAHCSNCVYRNYCPAMSDIPPNEFDLTARAEKAEAERDAAELLLSKLHDSYRISEFAEEAIEKYFLSKQRGKGNDESGKCPKKRCKNFKPEVMEEAK